MPTGYWKALDLPQVLPVFPLDGALLLPHGALPLNVFEPRYLNMVDDAMAGDRMIGMIQTLTGGERDRPLLAPVGCVGRITAFAETGDGRYLITLTGVSRFRVSAELPVQTPYRQVMADFTGFEDDLKPPSTETGAGSGRLVTALRHYLDRRGLGVDWEAVKSAPCDSLVNSLSMALPFEPAEKQALLEAADAGERRGTLIALLEIDAAGDSGGDDDPPPMQ